KIFIDQQANRERAAYNFTGTISWITTPLPCWPLLWADCLRGFYSASCYCAAGPTKRCSVARANWKQNWLRGRAPGIYANQPCPRSEEHTSELQSRENLVCRLLL